MPLPLMQLKLLLPFGVFAEKTDVLSIVAETKEGSFGLLPHRLDCVAALAPGILIFRTQAEGEVCVAVDQGVLVKTGQDVLVSVRRAIGGRNLTELKDAVNKDFLTLTRQQQDARLVLAKMETGLLRQIASFQHG